MDYALLLLAHLLWIVPTGYLVWHKRRTEARAHGWIIAGEALGLRLERRVIPVVDIVFERLVGERSGTKVEVWSSVAGEERSIHAQARFDHPALFGLHATTRPGGAQSALVGPELRALPLPGWRVYAHDAERPTALLTRLDKLLRSYPEGGHDLTLEDAGVTVEARAQGSRAELESLLDEALAVRRRVLAALARLGPGEEEQQAAEAWAAVAERERYTFDAGTGALHGGTERFTVEVRLEHRGAFLTVLVFTLKQPERGRVTLGRAHEGSDVFLSFVGQVATPTGDPAFDARFRASAATREASAALLDEGARATLLELPEAIWGGEIAGTTLTLRADGVLSAEGVTGTLRAVDRLAVHLARRPAGGYRDPA